ncbi:hypothetical protein, partial [Parachlamydia acanthamoebae]|uniref:hypothetical protein n=1 Tax=Parachlamydia acanthamoebae TaxID=83552 RepID=UPI001D04CDBA
ANHSYQHDSLFNRFVKDDQRFDFNSLNQLLGNKLTKSGRCQCMDGKQSSPTFRLLTAID